MLHRLRALTTALAIATFASRAAADEPEPFVDAKALSDVTLSPPALVNPTDALDLTAFPYRKPMPKHHLRAALEILTVYGVGLVDYLLNTSARGGHLLPGDKAWDLRYDWPTFRSKLTGENYHLDTNRFNTNYISHPFAGTLYYTAARSNHLSVAESSGYAIVGGFLWEYFGEFREEVSINDIIVTPGAGIAIGETTMQIGGFFKRGKKSFANDLLATFFAPVRAVNDWADSAEPLRSTHLDDLGLPLDEWHAFELFAGGGATWQRSEAPGRQIRAFADTRFGVDMEVANLPGYGDAAHRSTLFDDGNAARLHFESTLSQGHLADALFSTEFMPAGYYWRDATTDAAGRPHGEGLLLGWRASFEYGVHDYDRVHDRGLDVITIISPIGLTAEYRHDAGTVRLRARLDLGGEIAGVESHALDEYRKVHGPADTDLQTVLKEQRYYHAFGVTVIPSLTLTVGDLELRGRVRLDSFRGIQGYDEQQDRIATEIPLADRRMLVAASAAYRLPRTRLALRLGAQHLARMGDVGEVRTSRNEESLWGAIEVRF